MRKFNIFFNYKTERQRSWIFLILPRILSFTLMMICLSIFGGPLWKRSLIYSFINEIYPYGLRNFIRITILTSFIIFLRNLQYRFLALNSLLRFVHSNLYLIFHELFSILHCHCVILIKLEINFLMEIN